MVPNISNGTMFGDLDLPLNVSRGLSAITDFLVVFAVFDFLCSVSWLFRFSCQFLVSLDCRSLQLWDGQ